MASFGLVKRCTCGFLLSRFLTECLEDKNVLWGLRSLFQSFSFAKERHFWLVFSLHCGGYDSLACWVGRKMYFGGELLGLKSWGHSGPSLWLVSELVSLNLFVCASIPSSCMCCPGQCLAHNKPFIRICYHYCDFKTSQSTEARPVLLLVQREAGGQGKMPEAKQLIKSRIEIDERKPKCFSL